MPPFNLLLLITIAINNHFPLIQPLILSVRQENEIQTQEGSAIHFWLAKYFEHGDLEKEQGKFTIGSWTTHP